jgi:hypothetical protein
MQAPVLPQAAPVAPVAPPVAPAAPPVAAVAPQPPAPLQLFAPRTRIQQESLPFQSVAEMGATPSAALRAGVQTDKKAAIKEFAKANKLSKEQAEAFLNLKKSEIAAVKAADVAYEAHVKQKAAELKASWHKELKSDKTFGGEKFAQNLHNVDKVLTDFLGETKKQLTDSKSMLPPYVMRDLAKLADHLYKGTNLVQGEATAGADEKHFLDELYN